MALFPCIAARGCRLLIRPSRDAAALYCSSLALHSSVAVAVTVTDSYYCGAAAQTPVAGLLDPAPTQCPTAPALQTLDVAHFGGFSGAVTLHSGRLAWIADGYYDQLRPALLLNGQG